MQSILVIFFVPVVPAEPWPLVVTHLFLLLALDRARKRAGRGRGGEREGRGLVKGEGAREQERMGRKILDTLMAM